ncbi:MAG: hypothetical protein GY854_18855 [Deltaproteobacteria bacterium]|nr:hypothetical protein [Deltaproteobacteria bacterium]
MDAKLQKRIAMGVVGVLIVVTFIADLVIHPHHEYFFWQTKQVDFLFGFLGAVLLMVFSLALGEFFLWKHTMSVALDEKDSGTGYRSATVRSWLIEVDTKVRKGQQVVQLENGRGILFAIEAPLDGRLQRCFVDPGEIVRDGETIFDLNVSKKELHDLVEGHGEEGSHA